MDDKRTLHCDSKGEERNRVVPRGKIKNIF